jgi:hypothetical protein
MTAIHLCWFCRSRLLDDGVRVQDVRQDTEKDICGVCGKPRFGALCAVDMQRKDEKNG